MFNPTPLISIRRLLVVGAVAVGATASTAGAVIPLSDGGSAPTSVQLVGRPPDVQDAAGAAAVQQYSFGGRLAVPSTPSSVVSRPPDIRDTSSSLSASAPDVVERYAAVHAQDASAGSTAATRPPDVADTALTVRYAAAASSQSSGFDWNDWAIGIGSGLALALILGAAVLLGRQLRHPVQTA
jgi:hypothetical protein